MAGSIYALIDCNNFYASCERVFNPLLRNRPLAILSNNDGCVIARSQEAKEMGVEMGGPEFKQRHTFKTHNVAVLSSNYALYGDISRRVMETLRLFTPFTEPYSIDEAFLELFISRDSTPDHIGRNIKETVRRWTGIPVSVGIAPSKTLAKIANETAKVHPEYGGVLNLAGNPNLDHILEQTRVSDIWGIGAGLSQRLLKAGVYNALQLKQKDSNRKWVRRHLKVNGLRTVMELNGQSCLGIEHRSDPRKGIMTSRSFGTPVTELDDLKEAVMLTGILPRSEIQADLFSGHQYDKRQHRLMEKMDAINSRYGKRTALFAGTGIAQPWQMKQQYLSRRFTTRWNELMTVAAD